MHYRNGREAHEGDSVLVKIDLGNGEKVQAGILHSTIGGGNCNGHVAWPGMAGVQNICITIGNLYHAEDAWNAIERQEADKIAKVEPPQSA